MNALKTPWRVALIVTATLLPAVGCKAFTNMFSSSPQPPPTGPAGIAAADEPAPPHTGGLSVLSGHPEAPGNHGSPAAGAIATGVGAAVIGAAAVKTAVKCNEPGATIDCLAGPGPGRIEADAGSPALAPRIGDAGRD
jgi:hypothetical protein